MAIVRVAHVHVLVYLVCERGMITGARARKQVASEGVLFCLRFMCSDLTMSILYDALDVQHAFDDCDDEGNPRYKIWRNGV